MAAEAKICQNCKAQFTLEADDSAFFERFGVPPPTFCPSCRWQRHLSFRNMRNLYKRKDSQSGKEIISIYSPDKDVQVLEQHAWHGDSWDPLDHGRDYDFSKPFFEQIKELIRTVPFPSMNNWDAVNSDYCNFTKGNKNCYLVFGGDFNEDTQYSAYNFYTKNSSDLYWVNKGEFCYELVDAENNYRTSYGRYVDSCLDVHFGFELKGCQNCIGCINLRNQKYHIFNQPYSPAEYAEKLKAVDLGSYAQVEKLKAQFEDLRRKSIFRPYRILNSSRVSGDNIYNAKNCLYSFDVFDGAEDCKYLLLAAGGIKDSYATGHAGAKSELLYDSMSIYPGNNVVASWIVINGHDVQHSIGCIDSGNIFGCIGLKNKQYCILNKQYSKEEYETLMPKIIEHMKQKPYIDRKGRVYGYGEFFPTELSPFGYNETVAYEYYPLSKEKVLENGWQWFERETRQYAVTMPNERIPDNIKDAPDSILNETIECAHKGSCKDGCTLAFRLIPPELALYRQLTIPLPRLCPSCRHAQRIRTRNPFKLWERKCQCAGVESENGAYKNSVSHFHVAEHCPNEFETSYAPERPEIVYCERCYQCEVA
ncbi:MAG: hypothetical protein HYW65_03930 [Candidatus Liptonbacteria bacterium]|nr:hypothetical protein [Candidatus Liptonbacteria bacterium]